MTQRRKKGIIVMKNRQKSEKKGSTVLVSVFKTKRQERLFATMALERMSKDAKLRWE